MQAANDGSPRTRQRPSWAHEEFDVEQQEHRRHTVFIREESERIAMNDFQRLLRRIKHGMVSICLCACLKIHRRDKERKDGITDNVVVERGIEENDNNEEMVDEILVIPSPKSNQYRLERMRKRRKRTWRTYFLSLATCCFTDILQSDPDALIGGGTKPCIVNAVHWIYRVSVVPLFILMCVFYYAASIIFAGFIMAAAHADPSCIRVGNGDIGNYGSRFFNAFALSWNTFSTTGYGAVYPALGSQNDGKTHCFTIAIICSIECFLGVLFVGFCGAILFGKVMRIHTHAQVRFSDPVVVQYGSGVDDLLPGDEDNSNRSNSSNNQSEALDSASSVPKTTIPLPVLEFRVVNRLFDEVGGEIIDANLNVVASVDAHDVDSEERQSVDPAARWRQARTSVFRSSKDRVRQGSLGSSETHSDLSGFFSSASDHPVPAMRPSNRKSSYIPSLNPKQFLDNYASIHRNPSGHDSSLDHLSDDDDDHHEKVVEEDPTYRLVGKRIYVKMNIDSGSHPLFKRVWHARHTLDESSPIVKPSVRRQIRRLGGSWPEKLNSHVGVRESLLFNQILVSLTGVANISASTVYAQKIYDYNDCNIGYQFVSVLACNLEGKVQVDMDLINDVREQNGGGGEPLLPHHNTS